MTEPKKQDGTMELDVNQIDLLDLPLPPHSKPNVTSDESTAERAASKGPPPLPPSLPPMNGAPEAPEDPPVPSLVLPEPSSARATAVTSQPVSARKLVGPAPEDQKSPIGRFLIGMGAASIVCVLAVVVWKSTHKTQATPAATSAAPAPTHAFTMAPIEFTAPVSSSSAQDETPPAPSAQASATAHASAAPAATTTSTAHTSAGTAHPTAPAGSTKPPRTDELIKVEN